MDSQVGVILPHQGDNAVQALHLNQQAIAQIGHIQVQDGGIAIAYEPLQVLRSIQSHNLASVDDAYAMAQ
jgi:hypothetical protein